MMAYFREIWEIISEIMAELYRLVTYSNLPRYQLLGFLQRELMGFNQGYTTRYYGPMVRWRFPPFIAESETGVLSQRRGGLEHFSFFNILGIVIPIDYIFFSDRFKAPTSIYYMFSHPFWDRPHSQSQLGPVAAQAPAGVGWHFPWSELQKGRHPLLSQAASICWNHWKTIGKP